MARFCFSFAIFLIGCSASKNDKAEDVADGNAGLASHPWWFAKLTTQDTSSLVDRIVGLAGKNAEATKNGQEPVCLIISRNGKSREVGTGHRSDGDMRAVLVAEGEDDGIYVMSGSGLVTRDEARRLLASALEEAQASRKKREATGTGNNLADQMIELPTRKKDGDRRGGPVEDNKTGLPIFDGKKPD